MSAPWEESETADGSWTLWNAALGEGCHSSAGAWQQATERYARACRLGERARRESWTRAPLLDIGTGLGLNLAAALEALEGSGTALEALSLELDPAVIERGLALYESLRQGPWERWHAPVRRALHQALEYPGERISLTGPGVAPGGTLELVLGDARSTLPASSRANFEAVFLDPFSPARAGELWEEPFLAVVAARMSAGAWLSTYSASFRVRLALARAGLCVGRGPRVGQKGEGTLARRCADVPALPARLVRRLEARKGRARGAAGPFLGNRLREAEPPVD